MAIDARLDRSTSQSQENAMTNEEMQRILEFMMQRQEAFAGQQEKFGEWQET